MKGFVIELQEAVETEEYSTVCGTAQEALDVIESTTDATLVQGLWLSFGTYVLKHGSFIDPTDLEVYGRQYYIPESSGHHTCIEAHTEKPGAAMAYTYCETLEELKTYLEEHSNEEQQVRLLHASTTFELHGRLVKGWNIVTLGTETPTPQDAFTTTPE